HRVEYVGRFLACFFESDLAGPPDGQPPRQAARQVALYDKALRFLLAAANDRKAFQLCIPEGRLLPAGMRRWQTGDRALREFDFRHLTRTLRAKTLFSEPVVNKIREID